MKDLFCKVFLTATFLMILFLSNSLAQKSGTGDKFMDLQNVFNPDRIKETNYKLVMFRQLENSVTGIAINDRQIKTEQFHEKKCLRITESLVADRSKSRTVIYIDFISLLPEYFESYSNDTLVQKATIEEGKWVNYEFKNGMDRKTILETPIHTFISNSFSELIQANDFGKNSNIMFATFTPGKPINQFQVERIDEMVVPSLDSNGIACWVLKFTRIDPNGNTSIAGYRWVEKKSGKVIMYKSEIGVPSYFTYQLLLIE